MNHSHESNCLHGDHCAYHQNQDLSEIHSPEQKYQWALELCRQRGLRVTKALKGVLLELIHADMPRSLGQLDQSERLIDLCDRATIYRLLIRLEEAQVVRRLGLHDRSAYFTLMTPGAHRDYLICTGCGEVEIIHLACPVSALEEEVTRHHGYRDVYHELQFYGRCPRCLNGEIH